MKNAIGLILSFALSALAQTSGTYSIEKSVVASGGGASSGGSYTSVVTAGQQAAGGRLVGEQYSVSSGFFTPELAPTAALVSVSGRVFAHDSRGVLHAIVSLTNASGTTRTARTNSFGSFRFTDVEIGQAYLVSVRSKGFQYTSQVVNIMDEISELNFTAL